MISRTALSLVLGISSVFLAAGCANGDGSDSTVADPPQFAATPQGFEIMSLAAIDNVTQLAAGSRHTCALRSSGDVICWGDNSSSQIAWNPTLVPSVSGPVAISLSGITAIAAGANHTCALDKVGSVWCWGANDRSQLGNGRTGVERTPDFAPARVVDERGAFIEGATALSAGSAHTCVTTTLKTLCWGDAAELQTGAAISAAYVPTAKAVRVFGSVTKLAAGESHTCALTGAEGTVVCWGMNSLGQFGIGMDTRPSGVPFATLTPASNTRVGAIAAGANHTCVLNGAGNVACWGKNDYGQAGDGAAVENADAPLHANVPRWVAGFENGDIKSIAAGGDVTCALRTDGVVLCIGSNSRGQMGVKRHAYTTNYPRIVAGFKDATQIVVGGEHVCAIRSAAASGEARKSSVFCWGGNDAGQLGNGTTADVVASATSF